MFWLPKPGLIFIGIVIALFASEWRFIGLIERIKTLEAQLEELRG